MALVDLFQQLEELKKITVEISNSVSSDTLRREFNIAMQKINGCILDAEKEIRNTKLLLEVVKSLRNENENLKKGLGSQEIGKNTASRNLTNSRNGVKDFISQKISPKNIAPRKSLAPETALDIGPSAPTALESKVDTVIPENSETVKADTVAITEVSTFTPPQEDAVPIKDKSQQAPDTAMDTEFLGESKKIDFYDTTKIIDHFSPTDDYTTQGKNHDTQLNLNDYYDENETMKQLQMAETQEIEDLIHRKRLEVFSVEGKRYFSKKEVSLIRSLTMELATMIVQKPKKKNPLQFWKD